MTRQDRYEKELQKLRADYDVEASLVHDRCLIAYMKALRPALANVQAAYEKAAYELRKRYNL